MRPDVRCVLAQVSHSAYDHAFYVYYCGLLTCARVKMIFFKDLNCKKQNH